MSPSRRRAIGAVRGLASRALSPAPLAITHAHYPGGAIGTSRPTAITPAPIAPLLAAAPPARAAAPLPVAARHCPRWLTAAVRGLASSTR